MDTIRLYFQYIGVSFRSQMQYRLDFVMQSIGQFIINIIEFLAIWALLDRFGSVGGWILPEVAFLYGLVHTAFATTDATSHGFDAFGYMVRSGDFDRLLLRPRGTIFQLAAQEVTLRRIGRFLQGFVVLIWAIQAVDVEWTGPRFALLIYAFIGTYCLFYGLLMIQATVCFWTTESLEIMNIFTYGGMEMARFPMHIYGPVFRRVFTFLIPLACTVYLPAAAILGKTDAIAYPGWFAWAAPGMGILFLLIATQAWQFGVRHYQSTGS